MLNIGLTNNIIKFIKSNPAGVFFGDIRSAMAKKKFKVDDYRNMNNNRIGERLKRMFDAGIVKRTGFPGEYRYFVTASVSKRNFGIKTS